MRLFLLKLTVACLACGLGMLAYNSTDVAQAEAEARALAKDFHQAVVVGDKNRLADILAENVVVATRVTNTESLSKAELIDRLVVVDRFVEDIYAYEISVGASSELVTIRFLTTQTCRFGSAASTVDYTASYEYTFRRLTGEWKLNEIRNLN